MKEGAPSPSDPMWLELVETAEGLPPVPAVQVLHTLERVRLEAEERGRSGGFVYGLAVSTFVWWMSTLLGMAVYAWASAG